MRAVFGVYRSVGEPNCKAGLPVPGGPPISCIFVADPR